MGKRIVAADGTNRVEGKRSRGDGVWRPRAAGGWAWELMHDGQRLRTIGRTKVDARKAMKEITARIDA